MLKNHVLPSLVLILGISWLAGCSTSYYSLRPTASADTMIESADGKLSAISEKNRSIVALQPKETSWVERSVRPEFNIIAANIGKTPFTLGAENIQAEYNGKSLQVFGKEELVEEAETKNTLTDLFNVAVGVGAVALDIAGMDAAHSAGMEFNTAEGMTAMFLPDLMADSGEAEKEMQAALTKYAKTMLSPQPVGPGQQHGGHFVVEEIGAQQDGGVFRITVHLGDETHNLSFKTSVKEE